LSLSLATDPERVDEILAQTGNAWLVVAEIGKECRKTLRLRARLGPGDDSAYGLDWYPDGFSAQDDHFWHLEAGLSDFSQLAECARVVHPGGTIRVRVPVRPTTIVELLRRAHLQPLRLDFSDGFAGEFRVLGGEAA